MKKINLSILASLIGVVFLSGCNDPENDNAIESQVYTPPTVENCDDFVSDSEFLEGTTHEVTCQLFDANQRNLSASTFTFNSVNLVSGQASGWMDGKITFQVDVPVDSEGISPRLCVTPKTIFGDNNVGQETCFDSQFPIGAYEAPTATITQLPADVRVGNRLIADVDVNDAAGRATSSVINWYVEGDDAPLAENTAEYTVEDFLKGKSLYFTALPKSEEIGTNTEGKLVESEPRTVGEKIVEDAPVATIGSVTSTDDNGNGYAEVGETYSSSYVYSQTASIVEKDSIAEWIRVPVTGGSGAEEQAKLCSVNAGDACDYTITEDDLGYDLKFCVTPKTVNQTEGTQACSSEQSVFGVKFTGKLEFLETLTAQVYGYTAPDFEFKWFVDTKVPVTSDVTTEDRVRGAVTIADLNALTSDVQTVLGTSFEIAPTGPWSGTGTTLKQTLESKTGSTAALGGAPVAYSGFSDHAWKDVVPTTSNNASNYIGKEVAFCITDTTTSTSQCFKMSQTAELQANAMQVVDGEYGIAPVNVIKVRDAYHHRVLTMAEANTQGVPGDLEFDFNGIKWARHHQNQNSKGKYSTSLDTPDKADLSVFDLCKSLDNNGVEWFVPIANEELTDPKIRGNIYSWANNRTISTSNYSGIRSLGNVIAPAPSKTAPSFISPATGWLIPSGTLDQNKDFPDNGVDMKESDYAVIYATASVFANEFYAGKPGVSWDSDTTLNWKTFHYRGIYGMPLVSCVSDNYK